MATLLVPIDFADHATALGAAGNGDTILTEPGTYTGANNRNLDPAGLDPLTIISRKGEHVTIIDGGGVGGVFWFQTGETATVILDGFTIANGAGFVGSGGGVRTDTTSPTLRNLIIHDCGSVTNGGGIAIINNSNPLLVNVLIYNCSCTGNGGGILVHNGSAPVLYNVTLISNSAVNDGGGIATHTGNTTTTATNCIVWGNAATNGDELWIGFATDTFNLNNSCYGNAVGDVVNNGVFNPVNCTTADPLFRTGPEGTDGPALDYYLAHGSPCINTGLGTSESLGLMRRRTTRTDLKPDVDTVNMGYHARIPDELWRRRKDISKRRRLKYGMSRISP